MARQKRISIITPIYVGEDHEKERRLKLFQRCIESIKNQTIDKEKIEHIIVNDGSTIPLSIPAYPWIKIVDQNNLQRLTAYNSGFKKAKGQIFWPLDSDDEIEPEGCETVDRLFNRYPKYKIINFGCTFVHKDGVSSQRAPFHPKRKKVGHQVFGGGQIVNGTFVFKREVFDLLGAFPEGIKTINVPWYKDTELFWTSPYDFSAFAQVEFPEIQSYFQVKHPDHPKGLPKELGNPYGNDFYLFYKYSRKYHSKPVEEYLLRVNLK